MDKLIIWLIVFLIVYLMYLFFVILRKKKKKLENNTYINYLIRVYKLDENRINYSRLINLVSLSNSFIIATTFVIISYIKDFIIMMLLSFVVLVPLQLIVYHIIGKYLKRSEKNV